MDSEKLRELHKELLQILLDVQSFCDTQGISFFLAEGTLLGAMRHQGFIPWDDDVDIYMKREDYDRFLKLAPEAFKGRYIVEHPSLIHSCWTTFIKVRQVNEDPVFYQKHIKKVASNCGPCIDVFPLDYVPCEDSRAQRLQCKEIKLFRRMIFYKLDLWRAATFRNRLIKFASRFFTVDWMQKRVDRAMRRYDNGEKNYIAAYSTYHKYSSLIVPKEVYETAYASFEGHKMPVPAGYDTLLTKIYKQWQIPPANKKSKASHQYLCAYGTRYLKETEQLEEHASTESDNRRREQAKVSVIVPIYKVEDYLPQCLESLAAQTLDSLEVILVNDGSPDRSGEIAKRFAATHPDRFAYYEKENGGLSSARNFGVEKAHGEYLGFLDSDDYVAPDCYLLMYEKAVAEDSELVCCAYSRIYCSANDPQEIKKSSDVLFRDLSLSGHSIYERPELLICGKSFACNKLFHRRLFENVSFPVGQCYEDSAVVYNLLEMAKRISIVNKVGYYYRIRRPGSITADYSTITDLFLSMNSLIGHFTEKGVFDRFHDELEYLCILHLLNARDSQLKAAPSSAYRYLKVAFSFLDQRFPNWRENKYLLREFPLKTPKYEGKILFYHSAITCMLYIFDEKAQRKLKRFSKKSKAAIKRLTGKSKAKKTFKEGTSALDSDMLQEIQIEQREILKVIHDFCAHNGLRYYAAEGTLLGAVRHHGFIPWDDDMDLAMPREDYEKLIRLWNTQTISECVLLAPETNSEYYLPFIKIVHNQNVRFYEDDRRTSTQYQGLSIDIFPLDAAHEINTRAELRRVRKIRVLRDMMLVKVKYIRNKRRVSSCVLHGAPLRSMRSIQAELKKISMQYDGEDTPYVANYGSSYAPAKEIFPREWWGCPTPAAFDDTVVMVPENGEKILTVIYGDFHKLPPEEAQVCKHGYRKVSNTET